MKKYRKKRGIKKRRQHGPAQHHPPRKPDSAPRHADMPHSPPSKRIIAGQTYLRRPSTHTCCSPINHTHPSVPSKHLNGKTTPAPPVADSINGRCSSLLATRRDTSCNGRPPQLLLPPTDLDPYLAPLFRSFPRLCFFLLSCNSGHSGITCQDQKKESLLSWYYLAGKAPPLPPYLCFMISMAVVEH